MTLEIRVAETQIDAIEAFKCYRDMHQEGLGDSPLDPVKMLANVLRMMRGPGSIVFLVMDGETVAGVLSLMEGGYWYGDGRNLADKGLYVRPEYRNTKALDLLLDAAIQASEDARLPVYITIFNAKRKRGPKSQWERTGATLGYSNRGATLAHHPET